MYLLDTDTIIYNFKGHRTGKWGREMGTSIKL